MALFPYTYRMNIHARILARKITFQYFYQRFVVRGLWTKDHLMSEVNALVADSKAQWNKRSDVEFMEGIDFDAIIATYYDDPMVESAYIYEHHFANNPKKPNPSVDFDYIRAVASNYDTYHTKARELVDPHTTTFSFDEMDGIDQIIFTVGLAELFELNTPYQVVLNEMVELAKRYWDDSSPILINWIWRKVFAWLELT